jgi:hypothetical protein
LGQAARFPQTFPQKILNMPVHTAQFISCPTLNRGENDRINPEREVFFIAILLLIPFIACFSVD